MHVCACFGRFGKTTSSSGNRPNTVASSRYEYRRISCGSRTSCCLISTLLFQETTSCWSVRSFVEANRRSHHSCILLFVVNFFWRKLLFRPERNQKSRTRTSHESEISSPSRDPYAEQAVKKPIPNQSCQEFNKALSHEHSANKSKLAPKRRR